MRAFLAFAAGSLALVLMGRVAVADSPNLEMQVAGGALTATAHGEGVTIGFKYEKACNPDSKPCFVFNATMGTQPVAISGAGCTSELPGTASCPASSIRAVNVTMGASGGFQFNDGSRHSLCSPAALTVTTGDTLANVDVWNGCAETIVCSTKTTVANVVADAADTIRGHCFGVERH
ncbi:MAG: hypothetical protein JO199_00960 [Candidatus Eremiobacteraeota bacterium]|nr:hypothetical protein [Candidatus Eremiobacteraeota bacterium]